MLQFCAGLTNLIIQDKNFVDCDWGSDNLCSVIHDLNINIEENYVDVIAVQEFKNTGEEKKYYLGYIKPESLGPENSITLILDGKEQKTESVVSPYNQTWDYVCVPLKENQRIRFEIKYCLVNCRNEHITMWGDETEFELVFGEPTYYVVNEDFYISVKNLTVDRIISYLNGHDNAEWISENTFKYKVPRYPLCGKEKFKIRDFCYVESKKHDDWSYLKSVVDEKCYYLPLNFSNYFTKRQLRFLRNSIYALHGRQFSSLDLQEYFSKVVDYKINENFKESDLSEKEKNQIKLISEFETRWQN
ncbi:YARHG domain-containing protein [Treponema sp.]|uniref:YARHG domain-containing protein n=1 Tax=Treponema sp. TaxID=166 RepID=UPI00298E6A33|nr:YARHG domain-containing protein [Treponema sp.]MCQ2242134.1 YARHG domain-containing protein [Treponema sp.]